MRERASGDDAAPLLEPRTYDPPPADEAAVLEAVAAGRPAMWCEVPVLSGAKVPAGTVEVRGWALAPAGIDHVLISIDGSRHLRALHGLPRSDLRRSFGDELAAGCGFVLCLDPEELPEGRHRLEVVAVAADGSAQGMAGAEGRHRVACEELPRAGGGAGDARARYSRAAPAPLPGATAGGFSGDRAGAAYARYAAYATVATLGLRGRALDIGCESGWGTALLAGQLGAAVGVDPSPLALGDAEDRWGGLASFQRGELAELPFADDSFDLVACLGALAFAPEPEALLAEMRRVLRPGGVVAVALGAAPAGAPFHFRRVDRDWVQGWLESHFGSVRADDSLLSLAASHGGDVGSEPVIAIEAPAQAPGEPGSLLLASDRSLPPLPGAVLVDAASIEDERRHLTELWRERSVLAEVRLATLRTEAHYLSAAHRQMLERTAAQVQAAGAKVALAQSETDRLLAENAELHGSSSWRLTAPLRAAGRALRGWRRR